MAGWLARQERWEGGHEVNGREELKVELRQRHQGGVERARPDRVAPVAAAVHHTRGQHACVAVKRCAPKSLLFREMLCFAFAFVPFSWRFSFKCLICEIVLERCSSQARLKRSSRRFIIAGAAQWERADRLWPVSDRSKLVPTAPTYTTALSTCLCGHSMTDPDNEYSSQDWRINVFVKS